MHVTRFGPFRLEDQPRRLWRKNKPVALQPRPLAVLAYLIEHSGRVIPKEELLAEIWTGAVVSQAVLKVAVRAIREALGEASGCPVYIETAGRDGYLFRPSGASTVAGAEPVGSPPIGDESSPTAAGPVVGREPALDRLSASFRRVQRGERQVVFVAGEPGIGKSTLVERFARSVQRGVVGWGQCVEQYGEGEAYLPVLEALGQLCGGPERRGTRELLGRYAPTWLSQLGGLLTQAELAALAPRLVGTSRERMLRELAEALEAMAGQKSLVLVLEDLHVSDQSTVELLGYLARRRGKARLLIVGTYRSAELVARQHPLRSLVQDLKAHQQCLELPLPALTQADIELYLAGRLGTPAVPEGLAGALYASTEGLPLFLSNVVDYLLAHDALQRDAGGQWRLTREPESWGIPETVRDLIEHQLAALPAEDLDLLEAASVAGVEWSVASVAGALGQEINGVEDRCEALAATSGVLREAGLAEWPDGTVTGRYAFRHALHQNVLSRRLPEARRARLHRALGDSDEAGYGHRSREIAPALALHFERGRDLDRAARYRWEAAELALERLAYQEALAHAVRGGELLSSRPESADRSRRLLALEFSRIRALNPIHGHTSSEVEAGYVRARALCAEVGSPRDLFYVLLGLFRCENARAEIHTARQLAAQALEVAESERDPELIVGACYAVGANAYYRGQFVQAQEILTRGMDLRHPGHLEGHTHLYGFDLGLGCAMYSALCLWFLGYPDQAGRLAAEVFTDAVGRVDPLSMASVRLHTLWVYRLRRRTAETQRRAQEDIDFATRMDFPYWRIGVTFSLGLNLVEQGQISEGIARIEEMMAARRGTQSGLGQVHNGTLLAGAYVKGGRAEEALAVLDEAERAMVATDERLFEAEIYRVRGEAQARLGREPGAGVDPTDEALAWYLKALEVARQQGARSLELRALTGLARLEGLRGHGNARRELQTAYDWFTEGFETGDLQDARAVLAEPAAATGESWT